MPDGELRIGRLQRDQVAPADIQVRKADDGAVSLEFSASSENPVERWFGTEVLSHADGAIRMKRIKDGAVPLLFNHDWSDPIGMIDAGRTVDNRLLVEAHFFGTSRAKEIAAMVEGGLRNISIGYQIHTVEERKKDAVYTATDWEPLEISIVTVPADPSIGIGRGADEQAISVRLMSTEPNPTAGPAEPSQERNTMTTAVIETPAAGATAENQSAQDFEKARVRAIEYFCKANNIDQRAQRQWIAAGTSVEAVGEEILKIVEERGKAPGYAAGAIGMSTQEAARFSMWRALQAVTSGDWTKAGYELEASRAVADKIQRAPAKNSFFIPLEVQQRPTAAAKRDATVAGTGGYLVETNNLGGSFVELLRNEMVVRQMGARVLSGLVGNVTIPKQTAGATAYWLASESTQITEGNQTFGQLALSPKTAGAYTEISRLLRLQSSPDAEGIIMTDLAQQVALAADLAALNGSGSAGQPTGLIGTSGAGSVSMGTFDYADILNFQEDLASANALRGSLGYVTTPTVASLCMQRVMFTGTASPIWQGNMLRGSMGGYPTGFPAMSSNQVPTGDMIFGDWSQLVIGEWGVLEIAVDETANFQAGIVGIRCFYTMDVGVRIPAAFSIGTSAS